LTWVLHGVANRPRDLDAHTASGITVSSEREVLGEASVADGTLRLVAEHSWSADGRRVEVRRDASFLLEAPGGIDLASAKRRYVTPLRDLLAFFSLGYAGIEPIQCVTKPTDPVGRREVGRYLSPAQQPMTLPEPIGASEMLATWPALGIVDRLHAELTQSRLRPDRNKVPNPTAAAARLLPGHGGVLASSEDPMR
jgi:hypothetical protein